MNESKYLKRQERNQKHPNYKNNLDAIAKARTDREAREVQTLMNIRENIKIHRIRQRYSQQQLADATGLTKQTISNIETGKNNPTAKTVLAISNVLGVEEVWGLKLH